MLNYLMFLLSFAVNCLNFLATEFFKYGPT